MRKLLSALLIGVVALLAALASPDAKAQTLPQKNWVLQSPIISLGFCQQTSVTTAVGLSSGAGACASGIPAGTVFAVVQVEGQTARWRDDGTAPTSTVGQPLSAATPIYFTSIVKGSNTLANVQLIPETGSMTVDVSFYGVQ